MLEFFSPVSKTVMAQREVLPDGVLGKNLQIYSEKTGFPELEKCNLALFGIRESRRDINFIGNFPTFDAIRNSFYSLYAGNWHHSIADMGDIKAGATVEDTYFAVTSVVNHLVSRNIIPIILGGSQDLLYPIYRAYDSFGKMINFVNIDSKFDIGNADAPISNTSYVGKMVVDKPYNLFNYSTIGYQTYFNATEEIALLDKLFFDAYRLGEITNDISLVEPITRDADIVSMDVSAIKDGELSYLVNKSPNGFNSREICAISRYAGISNRVSVFGIFEISELAKNTSAAMLLAQVIWYFIEGVNYRIKDGNTSLETDFTTYKVPIDDEVLIFKKV